ncbi:MAG: HNH endonuclease [Gammaproteobacteria bacterium]|nr:HNH endonuclease [Gammaproteobacteria bacterium]
MPMNKTPNQGRLDKIVAEARRQRELREQSYREQALKLYPWVCGRCAREFNRLNLHELTVHHRDHDHDNNPADGSNWELLCIYCHENEHARYLTGVTSHGPGPSANPGDTATYKPFADLDKLLEKK